jgi:hypothetical protein
MQLVRCHVVKSRSDLFINKDIMTNVQVLLQISSHKINVEIFKKKKDDFFIFFRTYLNSDFRRFFGVETEVTIVDSC